LAASILAWASYWLVAGAGGEFLAFQWDALMLEMGFFSIFLALGRDEPHRVAVLLMRWLLFRVMFFSGYVKLASHDPAWRDLTALQYHFESQPLPTWVGWWFHQLPPLALKACAIGMFAVELVVPFLYFLPRRLRFAAFAATVALQILIDLTGNYGFFGWQTVALAILLLDDQFLRERLPARFSARLFAPSKTRPATPLRPGIEAACVLAAAVLAACTTIYPVPAIARLAAPLNSIHSYGVFAVMTRERNEIVFEGSDDGHDWRPYELKYKPGDLWRRPAFVEPHMPRLDWQLWFAALGSPGYNPWVENVARRLLQNTPEVTGLFGTLPFPDRAPKLVRASFYHYRFTDRAERNQTGQWWRRERVGFYLRPLGSRGF
jgi:hypothetical protein